MSVPLVCLLRQLTQCRGERAQQFVVAYCLKECRLAMSSCQLNIIGERVKQMENKPQLTRHGQRKQHKQKRSGGKNMRHVR